MSIFFGVLGLLWFISGEYFYACLFWIFAYFCKEKK